MKKRILSLALALCLLATTLPAAVFATEGETTEPCVVEESTEPCVIEETVEPCEVEESNEPAVVAESPLAAPVLTASNIPATGHIHLAWEAVEGAVKYHVYCSQGDGETYALLATVTETELTHSDAELNVRYAYYVVAEDEQGAQSVPSNSVYTHRDLVQPVLTITDVGNGQIRINWTIIEGAQSYKMYYSYDGENYRIIDWTLEPDEDTLLLDKPAAGETVYYKMQAEGRYIEESACYVESAFSEPVAYTYKLEKPVISLKNEPDTGYITISWEPIPDAVEYKVYRSLTGASGSYSRIYTTTKTSVTNVKNMVPGQKYYYIVKAIATDPAADSSYSAKKYRVCDLPRPVVDVRYDSAKNGAVISWEPIEGAVKYKVYRSLTGEDDSWTRIFNTANTSVTNIKNFDRNAKYYYKVRAMSDISGADSAYSEIAVYTSKLDAPVISVSNLASSGKIKVTWDAVPGATSYKVYRATSKTGTYTLLKTVTGTSFTNTSATAGKTYYYKVVAACADPTADSDFSNVKSRTCDLARPVTSTGLDTKGRPKVTWEAVEGAVGYEVYRSTTKDGTYKLMKTLTSTTYVNTSFSTYETYYYRVVALGATSAANSAKSTAKSVTSTSVNITPSKLNKDFFNRINEYREAYGIDKLDWHKDGELTCRTRAAEYRIDFSEDRPDGRSVEKMLVAADVQFEVGLIAELASGITAEDVVDVLMYYDEYADYAAIFMYEGWDHAVVAYNNGYWCIMFG